ncbi:hypothetical protein NDU88_007530 [Pleurodeles waltl]|uniref:Uncharacterized protein n=1 Tax=Pleurodeles waltl TaxID=8319 RepID=A0AAV7U0Q9_PLEWA|nr:hypothetical protein NDU88_007530 [Pleurodeles waltl]
MSDEYVRRALALLAKAGCMDRVKQEALGPLRPARKASSGVAAAVLACLPPRSSQKPVQVRWGGRVLGRCIERGAGPSSGGSARGLPLNADTPGKPRHVCRSKQGAQTACGTRKGGMGAACKSSAGKQGKGRGLGGNERIGFSRRTPAGAGIRGGWGGGRDSSVRARQVCSGSRKCLLLKLSCVGGLRQGFFPTAGAHGQEAWVDDKERDWEESSIEEGS